MAVLMGKVDRNGAVWFSRNAEGVRRDTATGAAVTVHE